MLGRIGGPGVAAPPRPAPPPQKSVRPPGPPPPQKGPGTPVLRNPPAPSRSYAKSIPAQHLASQTHYQPPPGGGSDVVTSGPDYGSQAARAFKSSPAYLHAVQAVFAAQPHAQQQAILRGLASNPAASVERSAIQQYLHPGGISGALSTLGHIFNPKSMFADSPTGRALGLGLTAADKGLNALQSMESQGPEGRISASGLAAPTLGRVITHAPVDVARAGLESPGVIPKTAQGLADAVVGTVAGTAELPLRMIQEGPGKAISQLAQQVGQDYSRRYGPLAQGNDRAFINRIKQEGAGPEIFDAAAFLGGADATAGRAVSSLAKTREALTGESNFLTGERPQLMLSGNKLRPQTLASTAGRASLQRFEDWLRQHRHGELVTQGRHAVAPIFQSHAIRVTHSGIAQRWRRVVQENLTREVRGRPSSAMAAIGRLNHWQRQAVYHAIHGIRVDTPENFRADLGRRYHLIEQDRLNEGSLGRRIPAQHADKVDELRLIDRLSHHADKITGPKMVAFQRGEANRAARIEANTSLHPATAEARRLRPVGDLLGIEHPDVAGRARGGVGGTGHAELPRPEQLAAYVDKVRGKMKEQGRPEPGYFKHFERPGVKYGDFTSGQGARAMSADKQSGWALHRAGVAWHSPEAYIQGLARSVKRPYQWRLTDEQYRAAALPTPTREEIRAALGHNVVPHLLNGNELRRVLEHRGHDMDKVAFYNPGRLAERTLADHNLLPKSKNIAETHDLASQDVHTALEQEDTVQRGDHPLSMTFRTTQGWKAVPITAHDEISGASKASSRGGRAFGKLQGTTAGLILGQNPHFLIMNTLAHAIPAVAGTKGRILADFARFPMWWHGLSDSERDAVRGMSGGRGGHYNTTARLGSQAPNQIATFGRNLEQHGLVQVIKHVNPLHAILKAEDLQSNFFRHAVMYHELKRAAFQSMAHEYAHGVAQWEAVKHLFSLGPQERMRAIMQNQTKFEELGRTVVNILGDYGRFTNRERQFLNNRAVLFYSFLRHVTRTLLYVLPVRHPLAFGMLGELGNLHAEEVKKLMGGQNLPWAYGRIFFDGHNKLRSVDMASTSPISSPLVDIASGGVKELPRLLSPALAPLLDVAYGQTPLKAPVQQNAWSYLNDLLSLSYPYRMGTAAHFKLRTQQSDSIPFVHERPKPYKYKNNGQPTKATQYQMEKERTRGPLKDYLLGSALGVYPKPDDAQVIAQEMAQRAASKGKGRHKSAIPRGGGSFGGSSFGGGFGGSFGGSGF